MFSDLPDRVEGMMDWTWVEISPFYGDLMARPLTADTVHDWLSDWTELGELLSEWQSRLRVVTTQDTTNIEAEATLNEFMTAVYPHIQRADTDLKQKLLESGLQPDGLEVALRNMRVDAELFTEANLPLVAETVKLSHHYNKIIGSQTVMWQGEELTLTQLATQLQTPERPVREQGWHLIARRRQQDRQALNKLWSELFQLRQQMADNAGYDDFRAYTWRQKRRFAYSPEDAATFQQAILEVGVPAASRVYERYRQRLGVTRLRPWDVKADIFPYNLPAIQPFADIDELAATATHVFHQVDPDLGAYFNTMRQEDLLDLPNRKGKAPGAYCTNYSARQRPFIFMNSVGSGEDVRTLLHEAGHAFHNFERNKLTYQQQKGSPMEFSEVASMAMELLAIPYLGKERGGFFTVAELGRWQNGLLEKIILFWPYMAVVDAFQHWAYMNPKQGVRADACDDKWSELWQQYIPDVDFTGLEEVMMTGWQRKQHIFRSPFYYIEYGLAQLGALQVWRNALVDQPQAVWAYRRALALGSTRPLPELYAAAKARFAFDRAIMKEMIQFLEAQLHSLNGTS